MKKIMLFFLLCVFMLPMLGQSASSSGTAQKSTDMFLLTFGKGNIETRLYSDYFCSACKKLEPDIEYLVADLVKRNIVTVTFVDTPLNKQSALYARYFLYILNSKKEIGHALRARSILFQAAKKNISDSKKLEAFLSSKGIKCKPFEPQPVFNILQQYLRTDQIRATPTLVVVNGEKKDFYQGRPNITKILEALKTGYRE